MTSPIIDSVAAALTGSQWLEKRWSFNVGPTPAQRTPDWQIAHVAPRTTSVVNSINYNRSIGSYQAITWEKIDIFKHGEYRFNIRIDDGARIFIDDVQKFSAWKDQAVTNYTFLYAFSAGEHKIRIEYYNRRLTGTAIIDYILIKEVIPPPTGSLPPPDTNIYLANIIKFSNHGLTGTYVKGTLQMPPESEVIITNTSFDIDVHVNIESDVSVIFTPNVFILTRNSAKKVTISFEPAKIESFPEGISIINSVIHLTVAAAEIPGSTDSTTGSVPPYIPFPNPVLIPITNPQWYNATKGMYVSSPTARAVICPPNSTTFYEAGDPNGDICLNSNGVVAPKQPIPLIGDILPIKTIPLPTSSTPTKPIATIDPIKTTTTKFGINQ